MRPGYDRVHSEIRRPPIPDVPTDLQAHGLRRPRERERQDAEQLGGLVTAAVFAFLLTIGALVALTYNPAHKLTVGVEYVPRDTR